MAVLRIEGGELALHLSEAEKVGAVHGDLRVPLITADPAPPG